MSDKDEVLALLDDLMRLEYVMVDLDFRPEITP